MADVRNVLSSFKLLGQKCAEMERRGVSRKVKNVPLDLTDIFHPEFTRDISGSKLVLCVPDTADYLSYQAELLKQNPHSAIIPFTVQKNDHDLKLHYQLGGRIAFAQYLQKEELEPEQIKKILVDIAVILLESKNWLLYPSAFLLKPEYIFLEPQQDVVSLIYLPVKIQPQMGQVIDVNRNFQQLLRSLFRYREDVPQILVDIANDEAFQVKDLRVRLEENKYAARKKETENGRKEKPFQLACASETSDTKTTNAYVNKNGNGNANANANTNANANRNVASPPENAALGIRRQSLSGNLARKTVASVVTTKQGEAPLGKTGMKAVKPKMIVFGVFLLLQLVLAALLGVFFPQVNAAMSDPTKILGVLLILVPLNVFFLRTLTRVKWYN